MSQERKRFITVFAIDPSQSHLGWSVHHYYPDTGVDQVATFGQLEATRLAKKENSKDEFKVYSNVLSLFLLEREMKKLFDEYHPDYVVSEGAFMARFPTAFVSLKLCINAIQRVLYTEYHMPLYQVAPKEAKAAVAVGTADKLAVQESIQHIDKLKLKDTKQNPLAHMTEHEADSIAIGYTFCKNYLPDLLMQQPQ